MQGFRNILAAAEESSDPRPALQRAARLAGRSDAALTVLGVLRSLPRDLRRLFPVIPTGDLQRAAMNRCHAELESLLAPIRAQGASVTAQVAWGEAAPAIRRQVRHKGHDLVVVADDKSLKQALLGSAASDLARSCPCPVLTVRPGVRKPAGRILAAVDPDSAAAAGVMEAAITLARLENSTLHVLYPWTAAAENILRGRAHFHSAELQRLLRDTTELCRLRLDEFLQGYRLAGAPLRDHLLHGEPRRVIPELALELNAELTVIGAQGIGRAAGFLTANVADEILRYAGCAVLTLTPETAPAWLPVRTEDRLQAA
jgi:universal stress protein E